MFTENKEEFFKFFSGSMITYKTWTTKIEEGKFKVIRVTYSKKDGYALYQKALVDLNEVSKIIKENPLIDVFDIAISCLENGDYKKEVLTLDEIFNLLNSEPNIEFR